MGAAPGEIAVCETQAETEGMVGAADARGLRSGHERTKRAIIGGARSRIRE